MNAGTAGRRRCSSADLPRDLAFGNLDQILRLHRAGPFAVSRSDRFRHVLVEKLSFATGRAPDAATHVRHVRPSLREACRAAPFDRLLVRCRIVPNRNLRRHSPMA